MAFKMREVVGLVKGLDVLRLEVCATTHTMDFEAFVASNCTVPGDCHLTHSSFGAEGSRGDEEKDPAA